MSVKWHASRLRHLTRAVFLWSKQGRTAAASVAPPLLTPPLLQAGALTSSVGRGGHRRGAAAASVVDTSPSETTDTTAGGTPGRLGGGGGGGEAGQQDLADSLRVLLAEHLAAQTAAAAAGEGLGVQGRGAPPAEEGSHAALHLARPGHNQSPRLASETTTTTTAPTHAGAEGAVKAGVAGDPSAASTSTAAAASRTAESPRAVDRTFALPPPASESSPSPSARERAGPRAAQLTAANDKGSKTSDGGDGGEPSSSQIVRSPPKTPEYSHVLLPLTSLSTTERG
jgi:hypothetical protein